MKAGGTAMRKKWKAAVAGAAIFSAACTAPMLVSQRAPAAQTFDPARVTAGATLAVIGDCVVCHTAPGGRPFAGGRALRTPFGVLHASNITPDPETGIGAWSLAEFTRAMREGIARDGRHLYPALPYQHFTRITDQDMAALYAFVMTRAPVRAVSPANDLTFPANIRGTLAGWNLLYLNEAPWRPDPSRDAEWNRGFYLVDTLGHCGACHTPRNGFGAERADQSLTGGEAEGWDAPSLRASSPAGTAWTVDGLVQYLRTGFAAGHGAAAGPMTAVTDALSVVPEADLRAIAVYVRSGLPADVPARPATTAPADPTLAAIQPIFAGACGGCHGADAPMTRLGAPQLSAAAAVNAPGPKNVIAVILRGIPWREGVSAPYMPGFSGALTDAQIADLTRYVRAVYGHGPAWTGLEDQVKQARREGGS
jgi:mono/diheme cytochrome c family protein